ncbi:MAG: hypothetical protein AABZ08_06060 [Planctomycetota bacterium]
MHRRPSGASLLSQTILYFLLAFFFGCDLTPLADLAGLSSRSPGANAALVNEDGVDNNLFDAAQIVLLPDDGELTVSGSIDGRDDIDIYSLGPVLAGDRVTVDISGSNGLNTVAAMFDDGKNLIDANDDRSYYAGQLDPYMSRVIRRGMANLYVGVAVARAKYFASDAGRFDTGAYSIRIIRQPHQTMVVARPQIAYLDFAGGANVQIALQPYEIMQPFSAGAISQRFVDQTEAMSDRIVELMRADFVNYNVVLVDGRKEPTPEGPITRLYFGNFNQAFLGLSDNVDTDNVVLDQKAIIYTEDYQLFESLLPTMEEVAQAIANTGSHELGHLLGLEHADHPLDIMSTAATARQILENDASFQQSPLDEGVFPAGLQNGPTTLGQNVGMSGLALSRGILSDRVELSRTKAVTAWRAAYDFTIPRCGRCVH